MKLFNKAIDNLLFKQYPKGSDLENQKVVAKIFNPYGQGRWYLMNSDPNDPDYLWGIVQMGDIVEMGSISRRELENVRLTPLRLRLERDLGFSPINAKEVYEGLLEGKFYKKGGMTSKPEKAVETPLNTAKDLFGNTPKITRTDWEDEVTQFLSEMMDVTRSDAQGIMEAQNFYVAQAWGLGLDPMAAAEHILRKINMAKGGYMESGGQLSDDEILKKTVVYDNGGESMDRYTVFTPDGSVYGMSENATGFNQYVGDSTEVEMGEHLGKRLSKVPSGIEKAVLDRMKEEYEAGGETKGKNGYIAFYKGKRIEVYADTMYEAQLKAAKIFNAKKSWEVNVSLAEVDGKQYVHNTGSMEHGGEMDVRMEDTVQRMDDPHFADALYYKDGGVVLGGFRKNIMGTLSIDLKMGNMRKSQDFIIYPVSKGDTEIKIQSSTRIGRINMITGEGKMSQSHQTGAYGHHLMFDKLIEFQIPSDDLLKLKVALAETAGKEVGSRGIISNNEGAADFMSMAGGGTLKVKKENVGKYWWTWTFTSGKTQKSFSGFNTSADAQKDFMYRSKYIKESGGYMAKGGGGITYSELSEFNKSLIDEKGYNVSDNILFSFGDKNSKLFPYKEIDGGKIIGFLEKGKYKDLYVKTEKGYVVDYYSIIKKYESGGYMAGGGEIRTLWKVKGKNAELLMRGTQRSINTFLNKEKKKNLRGEKSIYEEGIGLESWYEDTTKEEVLRHHRGYSSTDQSYESGGSTKRRKKATFDEGAKAIAKRLEGTKVPPKYRKEYGAVYDREEALTAGRKIKGKIRAKELKNK